MSFTYLDLCSGCLPLGSKHIRPASIVKDVPHALATLRQGVETLGELKILDAEASLRNRSVLAFAPAPPLGLNRA